MLRDENSFIYKVNFIEKILATVLAKMSNFIPEAGIWLNTQRPEWNDANNALVGNGVSMVTLCYLRRFLNFFEGIVSRTAIENAEISDELLIFFNGVLNTLETNKKMLSGKISDSDRKTILDGLGTAGSSYRMTVYEKAFTGKKTNISLHKLQEFLSLTLKYIDHTIDANKRDDNMYHAYNIMTINGENEVAISYLDEMLEGQVAALSSGNISSKECLSLLDGLKSSALFREDQYSYILYPNKKLPHFVVKNTIPKSAVENSEFLQQLLKDENKQIIVKDIDGNYHFNGSFNNANSLKDILAELENSKYGKLVKKESELLLQTFEKVFNHKAFTGRSGTFYGYEGLGSIYWHMVSKLQLAVQECCFVAIKNNENQEVIGRLLEHYYEINEGIGVHKPPSLYGAFPTDPYSHTPAGKGAQQPGMTGQVKEDILSRFGELGVFVSEGNLYFNPRLLRRNEFLEKTSVFEYVDVNLEDKKISLEANSLCFTYCQIPIIYKLAQKENLKIVFANNGILEFENLKLDSVTSKKVFERTGEIEQIIIELKSNELR